MVPLTPDPWTEENAGYPNAPRSFREWKESLGLEAIFVVPAGTLIQFPFLAHSVPEDPAEWLRGQHFSEIAVYVVNDILTRYRAAQGLTPEAGYVAAVSELELLDLSVQFFAGTEPRSPRIWFAHGMPGPRRAHPMSAPDEEMEARFQLFLSEGFLPLPVRIAFDAHSALYRRRYDEALLGFWLALEMSVNWGEQMVGITWLNPRRPPPMEKRVQRVLETAGGDVLGQEVFDALAKARKLRNDIVHGKTRVLWVAPGVQEEGLAAVDEAVSSLAGPLGRVLDALERATRRFRSTEVEEVTDRGARGDV